MPATHASADANLLFGVLALQMDFVTREQLVAAMQAWVNEKQTPLAEHLQRGGRLTTEQRQALEPLVAMHIKQHGGDAQQSLASLSSAEQLTRDFQAVDDPDVQHSVAELGKSRPSATELDPDRTLSVGVITSLGGRFHILRPHARGGLGEVFVARDTELGREVALKEIQFGKDDPEARSRFTREAEITGGLEHPGIVPVYGLGAYPDGRPFYAMRFIRGNSLQEAIKEYHAKERKDVTEQNLALRRLLQRFIDVCEAIDYAHSRGVLHRDLKPGNIMLGRYGETLVVDWGLAKSLGETPTDRERPPCRSENEIRESSDVDRQSASLPEPALLPSSHGSSDPTLMGSMLGTPAYMSPEQAEGRIDLLGPESDVFSLGATLYHLLTRRPPYMGDGLLAQARKGACPRPRSLVPGIAPPLEAICLKALSPAQKDRYATAKGLAREVERYLADEPVEARRETVLSRAGRWTRRNRHWVQAGGLSLVLVAVSAVAAYFYQRETAAQNLKLAREKGVLADEKGKLAEDMSKLAREKTTLAAREKQAREDSERTADSLRASLAKNYFSRGLAEYEAGRFDAGVLDLQRARSMRSRDDPLRPHYEAVLVDHATRGGLSCALPLRHDGLVRAVAFSPEGDRLITNDFPHARLWDARTGVPLGEPMRHEGDVHAAVFSPQGDRVVTGSNDGTARLWDARTGAPLGEPMRHESPVREIEVYAVAFSPLGDRVLTGSRNKTARLWDARTGAPMGEPMRHENSVDAVAFSPQGDRLVTASYNTARLWDARTGAPLGELMRHDDAVAAVSFSPQGDRVLTGSDDKTARLWDARTGAPLGEPMRHDDAVVAVFSSNGDRILTASDDGTARHWDPRTGTQLGEPMRLENSTRQKRQPFVAPPFAVALSPRGDRVFTGSANGTVRLWDARTGASLGEPLRHEKEVTAVVASPQGECVLTTSYKTARLWEVRNGPRLEKILPSTGKLTAVAFTLQGDRVVTGNDDGTAWLWDVRKSEPQGESLRHEDMIFRDAVRVAAFSPEGDRVLTTSYKAARLWDARTGTPLGKPLRHEDKVNAVAFSAQGDRVLTGSSDDTARLWDARTGEPLGKPMRQDGYVYAVAFSPQGDRILTGSQNKAARFWDARTGVPLGGPLRHEDQVNVVAFSPQGDLVVTVSLDKIARIWDARTGAQVGEPLRHEGWLRAVAFSPQGDRVVTGCDDKTARLWDSRTGAPLGEPLRHPHVPKFVAFGPQGDHVRTVTFDDKTVRLWEVSTPRPTNIAEYAALVTGFDVDSKGTATPISPADMAERRKRFYDTEKDWAAALRKSPDERAMPQKGAAESREE